MTTVLARYRERVDAALEQALPANDTHPTRLHAAMRYAVLGGGKRIRPALCYAAAEALQVPLAAVDPAAMAIELIHAYSLVHDDLPAMDDDDLRRGKPTCHIAFDEATAILAGDALQCLAFEVLSQSQPPLSDSVRLTLIQILAQASGTQGMAGGQALDLAAEGQQLYLSELETIHRHKTGCLIRASVKMGALSHPTVTDHQLESLDQYAQAIGLCFQVQDDILDVIGSTALLGKNKGADQAMEKATYPALLGLDQAKNFAMELCAKAILALSDFGAEADPLRALANYIVSRSN